MADEVLIKLDDYTAVLDLELGDRLVAYRIAGLGSRLLAGTLDLLIVGAVIGGLTAMAVAIRPDTVRNWPAVALGATMLWVLYHAIGEWAIGQTPGKSIAGIWVSTMDGHRARALPCLIRNLLRPLDWLPAGYLLGLMAYLMSGDRLGGRLSGTRVLQSERLSEALSATHISPTAYSTSEDGYLLDALLGRSGLLTDEASSTLSQIAANYYFRQYPPEDPALTALMRSGDYRTYLQRLYDMEVAARDPS